MRLSDWIGAALDAEVPPLRDPPPVRLFPHQAWGARRLMAVLGTVGGALLLDDVGMGKSFTAATVLREAAAAGHRGTVLVPRPLVETWRRTLARFGVDASVGSHDAAGDFPRSRSDGSLLVIDEAHRFRNSGTQRCARLAAASAGRRILLITATPLCNRLDELHVLVRLAAADDALARWSVPSIDLAFERKNLPAIRGILAILAVRRSPAGESLTFPAAKRRVVRFALGPGAGAVARGIRELSVPLLAAGRGPELLRRHFWRRYESSPEAFRESMRRQSRFYRRAREKLLAGFRLTRRDFGELFDSDEEFYQELLFPQVFLETNAGDPGPIADELERIERLVSLSMRGEPDKIGALHTVIGDVALRPALVFTTALATARRIRAVLADSMRVAVATSRFAIDAEGEASTLDRLLEALRRRRLDVLVLTDLAAEGLDLQAAASVIHYDLPWTAVRVRQRSGRAIRIGQVRSSVPLIFLLPDREARRGPVRAIARKRRLADAVLAEDLAPGPGGRLGPRPAATVRVGGGIASVRMGVAGLRKGGVWTFDPGEILPLLDAEVTPLRDEGVVVEEAVNGFPPRVSERDPFRLVLEPLVRARRCGDAVLDLALRRRFRMGVEICLREAARSGSDAIERVLASETLSRWEPRSGEPRVSTGADSTERP